MSGTCIIPTGTFTTISEPESLPALASSLPLVSLSEAMGFFSIFIQLQLPFPQRLSMHLERGGGGESEKINTTAKNRAS